MSALRRRRPLVLVATVALVGAVLAGCGSSGTTSGDGPSQQQVQLTVLAAASLTDAFKELGQTYTSQHPGVTVQFSFAGSSGLVRQALDGAVADVLATASPATMQVAVDGKVTTGTPTVFARNSLALVVPTGNPAGVTGLADLAKSDLKVVICAPEVPCGAAAAKAFAAAGVTAAPDSEEQDVKAVLAKVSSGEADAGIVYVTDALAAADSVDDVPIPDAQRIVTDYPIVQLTSSTHATDAQGFMALVLSTDGQAVLEKYGFQTP